MTKARKILMLVENCPAPLDKRIWTEATALRDAGFQVSIICPKGPTMYREPYSTPASMGSIFIAITFLKKYLANATHTFGNTALPC